MHGKSKMITITDLNQARKEIQKLKKENKEVIVRAQDDNFNRKTLENSDVDMIIGLEMHGKKDYMKQRNSGLNEVLCKLAKKNNIKIGIDINKISKLNKIEKAKVLARVQQNIRLCKKTKTKIVLLGNLSKQDVMSFFISLKGSTKQGKEGFIKIK
jgi:ribonuclease P/MRP protein subunit RPP1